MISDAKKSKQRNEWTRYASARRWETKKEECDAKGKKHQDNPIKSIACVGLGAIFGSHVFGISYVLYHSMGSGINSKPTAY